jgi:hypothetical protein
MLQWKDSGKPFDPDRARIEQFARPVLAAELARRTGVSS